MTVSPNMFVGEPGSFILPASSARYDLTHTIDLGCDGPEAPARDSRGSRDPLDTRYLRDKRIRLLPNSEDGRRWNVAEEIGGGRLRNWASPTSIDSQQI